MLSEVKFKKRIFDSHP